MGYGEDALITDTLLRSDDLTMFKRRLLKGRNNINGKEIISMEESFGPYMASSKKR